MSFFTPFTLDRNNDYRPFKNDSGIFPNYEDSLIEEIRKRINTINNIDSNIFGTEFNTTHQDDTTTIHVGNDITLDDISIELSPDARTLTIEVVKKDEDNNIYRHMKQSYTSDKKFNHEDMRADLLDGDLVIYAPYLEIEQEDDKENTTITIKHSPELENNNNIENNNEENSDKIEEAKQEES